MVSAPLPAIFFRRQQGITLITTVIMLVLVMLLGVSAVMLSRSEFRLAGNLQFRNAALNDQQEVDSDQPQYRRQSHYGLRPGQYLSHRRARRKFARHHPLHSVRVQRA